MNKRIDFVVTGGVSVATPVGPRVPWWHFCRSGLGLVALFLEGVAYRRCGVFDWCSAVAGTRRDFAVG